MRSVHALISGRVQGVSFRAWTVSEARKRGLKGWVRNRRDGTVEAVFSGTAAEVETMLSACRRGPLLAKVKEVELSDYEGETPEGFEQRETV